MHMCPLNGANAEKSIPFVEGDYFKELDSRHFESSIFPLFVEMAYTSKLRLMRWFIWFYCP